MNQTTNNTTNSKQSFYVFCVFMSAVLFALAGILVKLMTWNPVTINGVRSIFSLIILLIFIKVKGYKITFNKMVFWGSICSFFMNLSFIIATRLTTAGNAIVLQFTCPIFIIIFSFMFLGKIPRKKDVITCLIVFAGVVCFFLDSLSPSGMVGNILAILSGMAYAVVFMQNEIEGSDYRSATVFGQIYSIVAGIPFLLMETDFSAVNITCVTIMGVFQLGLAVVLLSIGLDHVSSVTASITSNIEPILNPILVAVFYGETLGFMSFIGCIIVILSVAVYTLSDTIGKDKGGDNPPVSCTNQEKDSSPDSKH